MPVGSPHCGRPTGAVTSQFTETESRTRPSDTRTQMTDGTPPGKANESDDAAVTDDVSAVERLLAARDEPYARATVVRREGPVSANVGDRAVVTAEGDLYGWVGGAACAQSVVEREARRAIEDGEPRLIGIAPDPDDVDRSGLDAFPMRCHSEGVVEVFLDPVVPSTELVVVGDSPVAHSLVRLAAELDYEVTLVVDDADAARAVPGGTNVLATIDPEEIAASVGVAPLVVVASMGQFDARGIAAGVLADAPYVGLVASDERATADTARAADLADTDLEPVRAAVTNPAGVDVAAHSPPEIAASLLAEVVDVQSETGSGVAATADEATEERAAEADANEDTAAAAGAAEENVTAAGGSPGEEHGDRLTDEAPAKATDPVCGMSVDTDDPAATADYDGQRYYFCCLGCADSFEADPEAYLDSDDGAEVSS
jgi:xanthine dehydrogenase accessory factor